jgi:hypothetical protein
VALIKDSAIRLLSFKLTLTFKNILIKDNKDFNKNNKIINYNNYNNINKIDF